MVRPVDLPFPYFIVGGAVRDQILGVPPNDIDYATPLSPEQVIEAASAARIKVVPKGLRFGVVSLIIRGREYEVASFRTEWYGGDAHYPEGVEVGASLQEDLGRRDFTVNAMAMTTGGEVIDPFNGRQDLHRRIIRAVGDPYERLAEDAARGFRACRFATRLGFAIDPEVLQAIRNNLHRVSVVSVERVRDEVEKTLLSPHPSEGFRYLQQVGLLDTICRSNAKGEYQPVAVLPELLHLVGLEQNPAYHCLDAWEHTLAVLDGIECDPALRWAALLHDVAKGLPGIRRLNRRGEIIDQGHELASAEMAADILARLRVKGKVASRAAWLVSQQMRFPQTADGKPVLRWLVRHSKSFYRKIDLSEAIGQLLSLRRAEIRAGRHDPEMSGVNDLEIVATDILKQPPVLSGRSGYY